MPTAEPPVETGDTPPARARRTATNHRRRQTIVLIVVGVLAFAAHVVLGEYVLAAPHWAGMATAAILAVVLIKAAAIALGSFAHRRRRSRQHR